jgi:O-antigen/teichoic acid export membrane protein
MLPILATAVISIASVPIYFRVLGDQMYAIWFYVGTLTGAFGFMDLGMGVAVGRFMGVSMGAGDRAAAREYWSTGNLVVLPLIVVFALAFVGGGLWLAPGWFNVDGSDLMVLQWAIVAGGIGLIFSYYGQMWFVLAASQLDFRFLAALRTAVSMGTLAGSILVALVTKSAAWLVAFATASSAIQFFLLVRRGNRKYGFPVLISEFRWSRLLQMLPYTLKTFAQLVCNSITGSIDRILLGRLASPAQFASYNVSLNVATRLQSVSQAVMGPVFANSSRGVGGDENRQPRVIYGQTFEILVPSYTFATLWLISWQQPLLQAWLGEERGALTSLSFPWLVAALGISAIANISTAQLGSLDRVGTGLAISLAQNLLAGLLTYAGWQSDGLRGAAIGFLLSRTPMLLQDWFVRHHIGYKVGKNERKLLLAATSCGLFSVVASMLIRSAGLPTWSHFAAATIIGFAGCLSILMLLKSPDLHKSA